MLYWGDWLTWEFIWKLFQDAELEKRENLGTFGVRNLVEISFWLYIIFPSSGLHLEAFVIQKASWREFIIAMEVKQNIHGLNSEHRWLEKRNSVLQEMLIL